MLIAHISSPNLADIPIIDGNLTGLYDVHVWPIDFRKKTVSYI